MQKVQEIFTQQVLFSSDTKFVCCGHSSLETDHFCYGFMPKIVHPCLTAEAVSIPIWVCTGKRRRVFLCPHKSWDQLGPVFEQWLSGVGQKSVQSFNQNECNANLLLGNKQIGNVGYRSYSVSYMCLCRVWGHRLKLDLCKTRSVTFIRFAN